MPNSVNVEFDDMLRGEIVARMVKEYENTQMIQTQFNMDKTI